jgi:hypothetical protein
VKQLRVVVDRWGLAVFRRPGGMSPDEFLEAGSLFVELEALAEERGAPWTVRILSPQHGICWIRRVDGRERSRRVQCSGEPE